MDKYTYMTIKNRITEINQEQLQILDYIDSNLDVIIDQQKENMNTAMAALKQEKQELEMYLIEDNVIEV